MDAKIFLVLLRWGLASRASMTAYDMMTLRMKKDKTSARQSKRRSTRIVLRVGLLINSADPSIPAEWEQVETQVVSRHGGLISTRQSFPVGTILDIRRRDRERSARVRVVWTSPKATPNRVDMGFEILDDSEFWGIEFAFDRFSDNP